jgi:hypothetical protein
VDWDTLAALGLPLRRNNRRRVRRDGNTLVEHLIPAIREVPAQTRESEAVQALLLALRIHFPSFYQARLAPLLPPATSPEDPAGRVVKLARIATSALAEYL